MRMLLKGDALGITVGQSCIKTDRPLLAMKRRTRDTVSIWSAIISLEKAF